jgi:hypothetical protein
VASLILKARGQLNMATYMIYQRTNVNFDLINSKPNGTHAKAYFALNMPTRNSVEDAVVNAIFQDMYAPTMVMHDDTETLRTPFEAIFDEGNGYGDGTISSHDICKHPSMSVGDLLVDLTRKQTHVCMPTGWHDIDVNVQLDYNPLSNITTVA